MPRVVAALDADVLIPILSCDLLLTSFDHGLFEPVVSTDTLGEVERNLIADTPHLNPVSLHRRVDQMRDALEDNIAEGSSRDGVLDAINPKDRHVVAAALNGEASIVVTNDGSLRSEIDEAVIDLVAMSGDAFATHVWQRMPDDLDEVIRSLVAKRTKRPVTVEELMEAMLGPFPTMASAWLSSRSG